MSNQPFLQPLAISDLITIPLLSACDAQKKLSVNTTDFINNVGLTYTYKDEEKKNIDNITVNNINFEYQDGDLKKKISLPLLSIINIPSLSIKEIDVDFNISVNSMEINQSNNFSNTNTNSSNINFSDLNSQVKIDNVYNTTGTISSASNNNTLSTNSSYHVHIKALDQAPTGIKKLIDILTDTITVSATSSRSSEA
jgi:hypothetical protein